uniref:Uncharacterized protein n=1 Tax=Ditylenchus dipsaci TaxID=166011 RepID=A0A915EGP5_9BILA
MSAFHSLTTQLNVHPHHWRDTFENVLTSMLEQDFQTDYSSTTLAQFIHLFLQLFESNKDLQKMILSNVNTVFNELQQNDNALSELESLLNTFSLSFLDFRLLTLKQLEMFFARRYELKEMEFILVSWMDEFTEKNLAMKFSTKLVHELLELIANEMADEWKMVMYTYKLVEPWFSASLKNMHSRIDDIKNTVHTWKLELIIWS